MLSLSVRLNLTCLPTCLSFAINEEGLHINVLYFQVCVEFPVSNLGFVQIKLNVTAKAVTLHE